MGKSGRKQTGLQADVVLVEPEIPQNTGNIVRTCAALGCKLHLIEPLGFSLEDRFLRRAGLDYWPLVEVKRYPDIETFFSIHRNGRPFFFSKKVQQNFWEADFRSRIYLFFGKESTGLPATLLEKRPMQCYRIPMRPEARSLNLAVAVSVVLYEAFRQNSHFDLLE